MRRKEANGQVPVLSEGADATKQLSDILLASLAALADTGEAEAACRFAGQACMALRPVDAAAARRFDVLLHRLTPRLKW